MGETSGTPQKILSILIVDDDDGDRKQIKRVIKQTQLACRRADAASMEEALAACETDAFDCAIVDYRLPAVDGLAGIAALHERFPYIAMIMATGQGDEVIAAEAMKRGATDYIRKTDISEQSIRRTIDNSVEKATLLRKMAQQREELEVFSRVLVHDLKAPIHTMLGFAALIEESMAEGNPEEVRVYCEPIVRGIQRMSALIDTLYSYTRADASVELGALEMGQVMLDILSNLGHLIQARGAHVTYGLLPAVSGTAQLAQLLQNLIGNGITYCEAEVPQVHVAATPQEGNVWLFSVKDNGIGIPEKHYQDVFVPFSRLQAATKYEVPVSVLPPAKKSSSVTAASSLANPRKAKALLFSSHCAE
jgi:signal transduction histidine kinase